jgi:hypothetical protein
MDTNALARSTLVDLQDTGTLFLRRQCSIGVLRVNFDRAATRLRLVAPEAARGVREYVDELDRISAEPANRQFGMVSGLLDQLDRWARDARSPSPVPAAAPAPVEVEPAARPAPAVEADEVQVEVEVEEPEPPPPPPVFMALPVAGDAPPPPPVGTDDARSGVEALDPPTRRAL